MVIDPLLGRVIDGKYRIDAEIGAGGMATIYRATRLHIGDVVAIKVLHSELLRDPQFAERFKREAQAAARLKHPNVVAIYDFGVSSDGVIYLVMELVEGRNLRAIIKDTSPLPVALAAEIIRQVCAALTEAHRQHIIHRDIKPANIAVESGPDGPRVTVLDFGIASLRDGATMENLTQTGAVMGTPAYMSPEQCLGEELDGRSDIYSLGVVLFEMLCGVVPFNSPTATAVVMQHVQQAPPQLRVLNASISPAAEAVVLRALAKRREDRFQTARDFADALTTAVTGPRLSLGVDTVATPAISALQRDATTVQPAPHDPSPSARPRGSIPIGIIIGASLTIGLVVVWFGVQRWTAKPGAVTVQPQPTARAVAMQRATSLLTAPPAPATVSGAALQGSWEIAEDNVHVGTILWAGDAVVSPQETIVFEMRKRSVAGRLAVPCESHTLLRIEFSLRTVDQIVPYREVNCEGTASTGAVHVTNLLRSDRTFSGSFWQNGAKLGNFIARRH
jgi:serine/threonine protein kinase